MEDKNNGGSFMAVNQEQIDNMVNAASQDDSEAKLKNLEQEVDLIKTSIKRLLMDFRERMNDLENPHTTASSGSESIAPDGGAALDAASDAQKSALEAREAALDAKELQMDATKAKLYAETRNESPKNQHDPETPSFNEDNKVLDARLLALLKSQIADSHKSGSLSTPHANEKLKLNKVYHLFRWTHGSVRKFGHDRLEIMLESYRIMGYLSKASVDEIRGISRLMPGNLGEENEVDPEEFVSVLYNLNRILEPNDISLDRDMIEVLTVHRQKETGKHGDLSDFSLSEMKKSSPDKPKVDERMNLAYRI